MIATATRGLAVVAAVAAAAVSGALAGAVEAAEAAPGAARGGDGGVGGGGNGSGGGGPRAGEDYEMYDYSWNESHGIFNWGELGPALLVYGATFALGVAGNSLIIFTVCRYRRMSTTTNVFLASLASADLLLITVCIPVKVAKLFSYTWTMGAFLCKTVHYMQSVSFVCSVLTLTAMSIERYYAIVHPMRAKYICTISQARKIILGIWCASFLLAMPAIFVQIQLPVGLRVQAFWCVRDWEHEALWRLHELYMLVLILVVPTCIMAAAYTAICWEVWHVMQRRCDMTAGHSRHAGSCRRVESVPLRSSAPPGCGSCGGGGGCGTGGGGGGAALNGAGSHRESLRKISQVKAEQEAGTVKQLQDLVEYPLRRHRLAAQIVVSLELPVIKMLVAVVVLFVLCWGPLLVDNVLTAFSQLPSYRTDSLKHMATAFHLMAYFNSCINPIVYGFMSKNFRESFYKALCRCCYRGSAGLRLRPSSLSHTRSTSVRYTTDPSCGRRISVTTSAF